MPDDKCRLGRGHKPHCVYRSAGARDRYRCLLGSLVSHNCCERGLPKTRARTGVGEEARGTILSSSRNNSRNKNKTNKRRPPPNVVPVPENFTIQRAGRGEIQVVELLAPTKKKKQQHHPHHDRDNDDDEDDEDEDDEEREKNGRVWKEGKEAFVKLPCEMVPAAPDFARDLDALGAAHYGVGQRADLRGRMWVHGEDNVAAGGGGGRVALEEEERAAVTTKTTSWGVRRSCPGGVLEGWLGGERAAGVYGGGGGYGGYNDEEEVGVFADRHMDVDEYADED